MAAIITRNSQELNPKNCPFTFKSQTKRSTFCGIKGSKFENSQDFLKILGYDTHFDNFGFFSILIILYMCFAQKLCFNR